jgi:peptidoglycan/LPS O-acetylase OafA/YrhL
MEITPNIIVQVPQTQKRSYMVQLDALRALAVFGVLVSHFLPESLPVNAILQPGSLGVRLFFVLSGFLITGILLDCKAKIDEEGQAAGFTIRQFYIRRFLRILPIYYLTLFVALAFQVESVRKAFLWHFAYLSNVYFQVQGTWDSETSHFWSLSVEEQFYLIWPCIILFVPRQYLHRAILGAIAIAPLFNAVCLNMGFASPDMGVILPFTFFDSLALGGLLAFYNDRHDRLHQKWLCYLSMWVGGFLIVVLHLIRIVNPTNLLDLFLGNTIISLFFVWVIDRASRGFRGMIGKILEIKILMYLGKISYGIYIYHLFMPLLTFRFFSLVNLPYPQSAPIKFVLNTVATLIVAIASWHLIEKPINQFKRHFEYSQKKMEVSR